MATPPSHSPGVDYSQLISEHQNSISWNCVLTAHASEGLRGGLYIVGFRSKRSRWSKDGRHRSFHVEKGGGGAAKESGRATCSLF